MNFLSEKMKTMLGSKQSDQFDTLRLTDVIVEVSGFPSDCFPFKFLLPLSAYSRKRLEMKRKILMACKKS